MKSNVVFEIGTEELPALELHNTLKQVEDLVCNQKGKHFEYDDIKIYSTPRRIIVCINGVPEKVEAKTEVFQGPKLAISLNKIANIYTFTFGKTYGSLCRLAIFKSDV